MIDLKLKLPDREMVHLKKCRSCKSTFIITSQQLYKTDCCDHSSLYDVQKRFTNRFILGSIFENIIYLALFLFSIQLLGNISYDNIEIIKKIYIVFGVAIQLFTILVPLLFYRELISLFMLSSIKIKSEIQNGFDNSEIYIHNAITSIVSYNTEPTKDDEDNLFKYYRIAYELSKICDSPILACARLRALLALPMSKNSFIDLEQLSLQLTLQNNIREYQIVNFIEKAAMLNPIQIGENTLKLYKIMLERVSAKHPNSNNVQRYSSIAKVYSRALKNETLFNKYSSELCFYYDYMAPWEKVIFSQLNNKVGDTRS